MAQTPEGRVKDAVKRLLKRYPHYGWWPVPAGFGENSLDWVGCVGGRFVAIETKAPGKSPTPLQELVIRRIHAAGGVTFVIDETDGAQLDALEDWLREHAR